MDINYIVALIRVWHERSWTDNPSSASWQLAIAWLHRLQDLTLCSIFGIWRHISQWGRYCRELNVSVFIGMFLAWSVHFKPVRLMLITCLLNYFSLGVRCFTLSCFMRCMGSKADISNAFKVVLLHTRQWHLFVVIWCRNVFLCEASGLSCWSRPKIFDILSETLY